MIQITNEYSNFPTEVIQQHNFKDIDDSIAAIVNQIKELQSQGKYDDAAELINSNAEMLKSYLIDTSFINTLVEEIRNSQIYALQQKQSIYLSNTEPVACIDDDVWIGG